MPQLNIVRQGQGPLVVLSHALGCDLTMWDGVAAALQDRYTVLRYDQRGHGQTPATEGAYSMDDLADDAAELIRAQGAGPVHFVGLSMGGMTAQALAARHPERRIVMVLDGAGWHRGQGLKLPANLRLLSLPPYAPELNPVEHVWDELREKFFHNLVFDSLEALENQLECGLRDLESDLPRVRSIVSWPWLNISLLN